MVIDGLAGSASSVLFLRFPGRGRLLRYPGGLALHSLNVFHRLQALVAAGLVDFIAMDVKAPWAKYGTLTGLAESPSDKVRETMSVIVESGLPHQFRTTRVTPLLTDDDYAEIERQIPAGSPFKWQTFIPDNALDPALRSAT